MAYEHLRGKVIRYAYSEYMEAKYGPGYENLEFTAVDILHAICATTAVLMDGVETAVEHDEVVSCLNELRDEGDSVCKSIDEIEFGNHEHN